MRVFPVPTSFSLPEGIYTKQFITSVPLLRKVCSAQHHRIMRLIFVLYQMEGDPSFGSRCAPPDGRLGILPAPQLAKRSRQRVIGANPRSK